MSSDIYLPKNDEMQQVEVLNQDDSAALKSNISLVEMIPVSTTNHQNCAKYCITPISELLLLPPTYTDDDLIKAIMEIGLSWKLFDMENLALLESRSDFAFVLHDFDSINNDFELLLRNRYRIYGPTVIKECAYLRILLPLPARPARGGINSDNYYRDPRPLFSLSMQNLLVCFEGWQKGSRTVKRLSSLVHYMGGSIRESPNNIHVTHVVSRKAAGESYRIAVGLGKPIMSQEWIERCWERRYTINSKALDPELIKTCKLKPFTGLHLHFLGFSEQDSQDMSDRAVESGATVTSVTECDHLIVDQQLMSTFIAPDGLKPMCFVVTAEWFWLSLQLEVCANESVYPLLQQKEMSAAAVSWTLTSLQQHQYQTNNAFYRSSQNGPCSAPPVPMLQLTSSKRFDTSLSCGSLDASAELSSFMNDHIFSTEDIENAIKSPKKHLSKRHQVCFELLQTESNYCVVLNTIINVFKEPLETANVSEKLLEDFEIREIFGNITKILQVHQEILRQLTNLVVHWKEDHLIGRIWSDKAECLREAYPKFVNFFENSKITLNRCARESPRFYAFLKRCENRPECMRQTLPELLIRPVQRLPSVQLLLNDLAKRTDVSNPDHTEICNALDKIREVLFHINEAKRETDSHKHMFHLCQSIVDCPAYLLSAHRQLLAQVIVRERTCHLKQAKGHNIALFLFNDCLEVAKCRSRSIGNAAFRHLILWRLTYVKRVIELEDVLPTTFYLITREDDQRQETKHLFEYICAIDGNRQPIIKHSANLSSPTSQNHFQQYSSLTPTSRGNDNGLQIHIAAEKLNFLKSLCHATAAYIGRANKEDDLLQFGEVDQDDGVLNTSSFNQAFKQLSKTGRQISRTISFARPRRTLTRTVTNLASQMSHTLQRMSRSNLRLNEQQQPTTQRTFSFKRMRPQNLLVNGPTLNETSCCSTTSLPTPTSKRQQLDANAITFIDSDS